MDRAQASGLQIGFVGCAFDAASLAPRVAAVSGVMHFFDPEVAHDVALPVEWTLPSRTLGELRLRAEIILISVDDEASLRRVLLGESGLLQAPGVAPAIVDLSPIAPWTLRELAVACRATGVSLLGGCLVSAIKDMRSWLQLYVDRGALEVGHLRDVLPRLADEIVLTGAPGAAKAVRILTDLLVGVNIAVVSEALALAETAGIDPQDLARLLVTGSGATAVMACLSRSQDADQTGLGGRQGTGLWLRGIERAASAARYLDHSLYFGGVAASVLAQAKHKAAGRPRVARTLGLA